MSCKSWTANSCGLVCRFFVQNKCLRGDLCPYSHNLPSESADDACDGGASAAASCSICLQSVLAEGKRFGLLPRCCHVFCLDCIMSWRARCASSSITRENARKCPVCRVESYFVIPSPRFYTGEEKIYRVKEYLNFLSTRPCRYYCESANTEICPFGPLCFFHHRSNPTMTPPMTSPDALVPQKLQLVYTHGDIN